MGIYFFVLKFLRENVPILLDVMGKTGIIFLNSVKGDTKH